MPSKPTSKVPIYIDGLPTKLRTSHSTQKRRRDESDRIPLGERDPNLPNPPPQKKRGRPPGARNYSNRPKPTDPPPPPVERVIAVVIPTPAPQLPPLDPPSGSSSSSFNSTASSPSTPQGLPRKHGRNGEDDDYVPRNVGRRRASVVHVLGPNGRPPPPPPTFTTAPPVIGRPRNPHYCKARTPHSQRELNDLIHNLPPLLQHGNKCGKCHAYLWREERATIDNWWCCANGKVDTKRPEYIEGDQSEQAAELDRMIWELEDNPDYDPLKEHPQKLTSRCIKFRKTLHKLNNNLSFASEAVGAQKEGLQPYCTTVQGSMNHVMGNLLPERGTFPQYAQVYTVDSTQEAVEARDAFDREDELDPEVLASLQRLLRRINALATGIKDCATRLQEQENPDRYRVVIRTLDPQRGQTGTHGQATSDEVAQMVCGLSEMDSTRRMERDVVLKTVEGGFQRISFLHSSFFALRYVVIYPYGEPGWKPNLPLHGNHIALRLPDDHILSRRNRNTRPNTILNTHGNQEYTRPDDADIDDEEEPEEPEEPPVAIQGDARGRGGTKKITPMQWGKAAIMVSPFRFFFTLNPIRKKLRVDQRDIIA